jgi:hypothetical protein
MIGLLAFAIHLFITLYGLIVKALSAIGIIQGNSVFEAFWKSANDMVENHPIASLLVILALVYKIAKAKNEREEEIEFVKF